MKRILILALLLASVTTYAQIHNWAWAKKGGLFCNSVANDVNGNVYVVGSFKDTCIVGNDTLVVPGGTANFYIAKYDPSGNVQWAKLFGSGSAPVKTVSGIGIDANSNIYISGIFMGTAVFGSDSLKGKGGKEGYVVKLISNGIPVWAKMISNTLDDAVNGIAVDDSGYTYITGKFTNKFSLDTNVIAHAVDVFVAKLSNAGSLVWVRTASDTSLSSQEGMGICIDKWRNVFVTGWFDRSVFFDNIPVSVWGHGNVFLARYSNDGDIIWAKGAGGQGTDNIGFSVANDKAGNVYVAGQFSDTARFDNQFILSRSATSKDGFLAKYDSSGQFLWARNTNGSGSGYGGPVVVDNSGNAYINKDSIGKTVACYDSAGNKVWSMTPSYTAYFEYPSTGGMSMDANNNLFVVGGYKNNVSFGTQSLLGASTISSGFLAKMTIFPSSVNKLGGSKNEHDILLSPNPASNMVTVDVQGICSYDNIKVYDEVGRVVFNQPVAKTAQVKQINLGYLAYGIYYLQASGGGQVSQTKKVIIQR